MIFPKDCIRRAESDEYILLQVDENASNVAYKKYWYSRHRVCLAFVGSVLVLITVVAILITLSLSRVKYHTQDKSTSKPAYKTLFASFKRATVVSNAVPCATIGKNILQKGGNAVDAMIATMLCDGVTLPQSMGIGGGFFMVIFNRTTNSYVTINARETAPAASTIDMFHGNSTLAQIGGLAVAVPGEIKGYWTAYQKFGGGVPWKELFTPTINLCENGIPINMVLASILVRKQEWIKKSEAFSALFVNPSTGEVLVEGDTYKNEKLGHTLRIISEEGGDALYTGSLAASLSEDIRENGGIITTADLANYQATIEAPPPFPLPNAGLLLHSMSPPSSGLVLAYILRILDGLLPAPSELLTTQRMTEAFKFGYSARGEMGDSRFQNMTKIVQRILSDEFISDIRHMISDTRTWNDTAHYNMESVGPNDHGTANLAVLSENGDAVVATSTINTWFASGVISKSTGIILNNEMDDFSSPNITNFFGIVPSSANFIEPGKRPMSSMNPAIIADKSGNIKLLIGAAGGSKITTAVAITAARIIYLKENIRNATTNVLFHHQLLPMVWQYYTSMSDDLVEGMKKIGHTVDPISPTSFAAVSGIQVDGDIMYGSCDRKRPGQVDGY